MQFAQLDLIYIHKLFNLITSPSKLHSFHLSLCSDLYDHYISFVNNNSSSSSSNSNNNDSSSSPSQNLLSLIKLSLITYNKIYCKKLHANSLSSTKELELEILQYIQANCHNPNQYNITILRLIIGYAKFIINRNNKLSHTSNIFPVKWQKQLLKEKQEELELIQINPNYEPNFIEQKQLFLYNEPFYSIYNKESNTYSIFAIDSNLFVFENDII